MSIKVYGNCATTSKSMNVSPEKAYVSMEEVRHRFANGGFIFRP